MDPPAKTPSGIITYTVSNDTNFNSYSYIEIFSKFQPKITLPIPEDHNTFFFFIHNKDQMYIPKSDGVFGSYYFYKTIETPGNKSYSQDYLLTRSHWKTLNTPRRRCDEGKKAASTTRCIARYLEQKVGCSMGLHGNDAVLKWYAPIFL